MVRSDLHINYYQMIDSVVHSKCIESNLIHGP